MGQFEDAINQALNETPQLQQMPGVAVALGQSQDPANDGQALAQVANLAATSNAYQAVSKPHKSWWDQAIGDIGGAVGGVVKAGGTVLAKGLATANKPLQEVQHEYRYIRDVYQQKGVGAGLAETLGALGGAAIGALATDSYQGAVLGAEGTTRAQAQFTYHDVWNNSAKGGGSMGRDVSSALGYGKNRWISGALDGIFDLMTDPLASAGGLASGARSAEGLGGLAGNVFKGTSVNSLEAIDQARNTLPAYNRALNYFADHSAAEIGRDYPKLLVGGPDGMTLAQQLGQATTADEAHQIIRETARTSELLKPAGTLPTMTLSKQAFLAARNNVPDSLDRFVLRPFTMQPAAFDAAVQTFSNKEFNVMDPSAQEIVRRTARFAETDRVANQVANAFAAEIDPARRLEIYNNTLMDAILARAKVDPNTADPNLLRTIKGAVENLTTYGEGKYVGNMDGEDISRVATDDNGTERAAGVRVNQIGKTAIPDYTAFKRASQTIAGYNKIFGQQIAAGATADVAGQVAEAGAKAPLAATADDWLYNHITGALFKPLVTLSGGTAERIGLSEVIPQTLKNGVLNTIKSTLATHYAELGYKVDDGTANRFAGAVYQALGGDEGKLANTKAVQTATKMIESLGGDTLHPAIDASHGAGVADVPVEEKMRIDLTKQVKTNAKIQQQFGDQFGWFPRGNENHIPYWQASLREAASDPATQYAANAAESVLAGGGDIQAARDAGAMAAAKFIRENPDIYNAQFVRFKNANVGMDYADHWGRITSEGMFGDVGYRNADGTYGVNRPLLQAIRDVSTPADIQNEIESGRFSKDALVAIPPEQQPLVVKGRMPIPPHVDSAIQRIATVGHRKVIEPIVNFLAREPIYATKFADHYDALADQVSKGILSDDQAVMLAHQGAARDVLPFIHNVEERSQLGQTVRNFMPFYFAQEQAYRRAGRLLADDSGAFRKYQLMMTGLVNFGHGTSDGQGNGYLAMPGTGFLTQGTVALAKRFGVPIAGSVPTGMSGNLASLNTVFPFVEDPAPWHKPGPLVSIPLKALENLRPEIGPITDAVVGPQATAGSLWDQIIPNQFIKNSLQALGVRGLTTSQYNSTLSIMQALAEKGQLPDENDAMAQQTLIQRAKNQSRVLDVAKALISAVSPTSPRVDIGKQFTDLANSYIKKYGDLPTALQHLQDDHPDMTPYTVFKSTTNLGENVPAYQTAENFLNENNQLIHDFPQAAAFLVPQKAGDTFSQAIYNEQLADHFRQRKTPDQFLKDLYIAAGNAQFYNNDLPTHQSAVDQLVAQGDTTAANNERSAFQNYINSEFGPQHPVWWERYKAPDGDQKKQQAISGLVQIFATGRAPDTQQSRDVAGLLADWSSHMAALSPGVGANIATAQRTAENQNWDQYLRTLAVEKPQLLPVINALFRDKGEKQLGQVA